MEPCFLTLASDMDQIIPVLAVGGGLIVAVVAIISGAVHSIIQTKAVEESRREIAAYVAEGSISPDDAQRILQTKMAGPRGKANRC